MPVPLSFHLDLRLSVRVTHPSCSQHVAHTEVVLIWAALVLQVQLSKLRRKSRYRRKFQSLRFYLRVLDLLSRYRWVPLG